MRLPREISPGAAARRRLLADILAGVAIGLAAIFLAAGVGVAGFFAIVCLLAISASYVLEGVARVLRTWMRR